MKLKLGVDSVMEYMTLLYAFIIALSYNTGTVAVKIVRVLIMGVFVLYFIVRERKKRINYIFILWAAVFTLYNLYRCQYALDFNEAMEFTLSLVYVSMVHMAVSVYLQDRNITDKILKTLIIAGIMQALYLYFTEGFTVFFKARATESNVSANMVGFNCAISCLFSLYFFDQKKRKRGRVKYLVCAVLALVLMILSASRKSFLILGIPIIVSYLLCSKDIASIIRKTVLVIICVILAWKMIMNIEPLYNLVGYRIESMLAGLCGMDTDASTETRMRLVEYGIGWWQDNPIWGYGLNNFTTLMKRDHPGQVAYYAHNNYIELLVSSGLVGTLLYYSMYICLLFRGLSLKRLKNKQSLMFFGILIAFIINDYGMVSYISATYQLILLLCFNDFFVKNVHPDDIPYRQINMEV